MTTPKVMIGVPTGDVARRPEFYDYLALLDKPNDWIVIEAKIHGQSPARNRNLIIDQALKHECTHIFFVDDDVLLPQNALTELMKHNVDMVTGLYVMRSYPHQPIIFKESRPEDGWVIWEQLIPNRSGLIEVVSAGLGCALIKTEVFKVMKANDPLPWVRLGEIKGEEDHWGDDIGFWKRARTYGYKLFCDLDVKCGHYCSMILRPIYKDGVWYTEYDTNGTGNAMVPAFYQVIPELAGEPK